MLDATCCLTQEEIRKIYDELDLHEKGITQEEIARRKTRIFVGGLKFASEDHVLHDYFSNFGKIKEAVVIRDRKTGLSKGYGFVTMVEDLPALKAILDKSPKLDGRRCNVNLAYIGQKNKPQAKTALPKREPRQISPQLCGYPNGIMVSPPVLMPDGQYYQYGTPPPSYYQPVYQVVSESQSPPPYDNREVYNNQGALPVATAMYPGPIVVGQPIIIDNPANPGNSNNNNIYLTNNIYYRTPEGGLEAQTEPVVKGDGKTPLAVAAPNSKDQMQAIHLLPHGAHILPMPPMAYPFTAMEPMNCTFANGEGIEGMPMGTKCDPSEMVSMVTYQSDAVAAKKLMLQHPASQQPAIIEVTDDKNHNNV